jgi:hypothetical protein
MKVEKSKLEKIAKHGSGPVERSLAVVKLYEKEGRLSELRKLLDRKVDSDLEGEE